MFKFLKDKLKKATESFSKSVKEEVEEEPILEQQTEEEKEIEDNKKEKQKETKKKEDDLEEKEDIKLEAEKKKKEEQERQEAERELFDEVAKELEEEGIDVKEELDDIQKEKEEIGTVSPVRIETDKEIIEREIGVSEEVKEEPELVEKKEVEPKKKGFFSKLKDVFVEREKDLEEKEEELEKEIEDLKDEEAETHKNKEKQIIEKELELQDTLEKEDKIKKVEKKLEEKENKLEKEKEIRKDLEEEQLEKEEKQEEKKGFFGKFKEVVTHKKLSDDKFNDLFWELELALLENNVAVEVIEKVKGNLREELVDTKIQRFGVDQIVTKTLKSTIEELFDIEKIDLIEKIKQKKKETGEPFVISFIGINGSGKTTTLAKIAHLFKKNNLSCVIAAADTFRVAAIEQLGEHAKNLDIKMIKQDYQADAAAVAFDAIQHAKSKNLDVVLIDTAGRMQANVNLMEELKKLVKVAKPDMNIFIGDSVTGNDAVEQAQKFDEWVGIDGIVLSKADVDEKGGCSISISYVTKKPILYIGVGQTYDDLKEFDSSVVLENLGLA